MEKSSDVPAISDDCNEVTKHINGIAFSRKAGGTAGWAAAHGQVLRKSNLRIARNVSRARNRQDISSDASLLHQPLKHDLSPVI
jgi:hypothetical protein